jgi:hypothetical protein
MNDPAITSAVMRELAAVVGAAGCRHGWLVSLCRGLTSYRRLNAGNCLMRSPNTLS